MSPQFVDFDADGHTDIVCGIFDGSPHVSYWDAEKGGWKQPVTILDREGQRIVLNAFWDFDASRWEKTDRCDPDGGAPAEGHLTSAIAFDYDHDGDWDLVLGDHRSGYVYLRRNEGSNAAPAFATRNELVLADGQPIHDPGTVATVRAVDWNGDHRLDLIVSGMGEAYGEGTGGGVVVHLDTARAGPVKLGAAQTLIARSDKSAHEPVRPDVGLHPEAVDVDGDGDLDLIVGGYAMWTPAGRELSPSELLRVDELRASIDAKMAARAALIEEARKASEGLEEEAGTKAYTEAYEARRPKMDALLDAAKPLRQELAELVPNAQRVSFTWLYENLANGR